MAVLLKFVSPDREKFEKIKDEITAIREKLDALTSAGQESIDKGTCKIYR